jgi:hypothetical protein
MDMDNNLDVYKWRVRYIKSALRNILCVSNYASVV